MISLFTVSSTLSEEKEIGKQVREKVLSIFKGVENLEVFDLIIKVEDAEKITKKFKDKISGCIVAVATGGTERIIRIISNNIGKPVLLWANPFNNSLASSLKAFSKLRQNIPVKIFYSELDSGILGEVKSFIRVCDTINRLKISRLGCIGEPKWILASDNKKIIRQFGPEIVKMKIEYLVDAMKKVSIDEVKDISKKLKKFRQEFSEDEMTNAVRIYLAMKELISKHKLSAITIRCFDLLKYNFTACLGVSMCNDEGLVAGCEADLQAILTMMIVSFLTAQPCWMANPSRIDKDKNTITLAHCTIATKMIKDISESTLLPHMESGKGVSIRGQLKNNDVTLVRLGGNLDKMLIVPGKIIKNMQEPNLCRTQVEVKLKGNVED